MFVWRYLDAEGGELGASEEVPDQGSAEDWLRERWQDLADDGVAEVILSSRVGPEDLYRMSLRD
jgi:hypothetical protein